jgi:hypothetical protein
MQSVIINSAISIIEYKKQIESGISEKAFIKGKYKKRVEKETPFGYDI